MSRVVKAIFLAGLSVAAIAAVALATIKHDDMTPTHPANSKAFRDVLKIEQRIESTAEDAPRAGYVANMFGGYDREDLTLEVLRLYDGLLKDSPDDKDLLYRYAGTLARAKRYDEARRIYTSLLETSTPAHLMLAMLDLDQGDRSSAERRLAIHNERRVAEGMPFLQSSIEKIALKK